MVQNFKFPCNASAEQSVIADEGQIRQTYDLIIGEGAVEVRAFDAVVNGRRCGAVSGYARSGDELVRLVSSLDYATGVHIMPNPLGGDGERAAEFSHANKTANDADVSGRRWFLIDVDSERAEKKSAATDAEIDAAYDKALKIIEYLCERLGWAKPIIATSGNGVHLLYRVDLPTDDGKLLQSCLGALAPFGADQQCKPSPSRLTKLYGTWNRKGEASEARPHRKAEIIEAPASIEIVTRDKLEALGRLKPAPRSIGGKTFKPVTAEAPCKICGKPDWCMAAPNAALCNRESEWKGKPGEVQPGGGHVFRFDEEKAKGKLADRVLTFLDRCEFWLEAGGGGHYVTVPPSKQGGASKHLPVHFGEQDEYMLWLSNAYRKEANETATNEAIKEATRVHRGAAIEAEREYPLYRRIGEHHGKIYLDLCDKRQRIIEIDGDGWRIADNPPLRFRRTKLIEALPMPEQGGSIEELKQFINVPAEEFPLVLGWLIMAFRPTGPYPVLAVKAKKGSAKSTLNRVLRGLVDPSEAINLSKPKNEEDVWLSAESNWVLAYDNLSGISEGVSDTFCQISTGGAYSRRTLYSDGGVTVWKARRPLIITAIDDIVDRPDLLDRCVLINPQPISDEKRLSERAFDKLFNAARPRILGALLTAVSGALKRLPDVRLERLPRMADFAEWAVAAEPDLGLSPGAFIAAYMPNREQAGDVVLNASRVNSFIINRLRFIIERAERGALTLTVAEWFEWLTGSAIDAELARNPALLQRNPALLKDPALLRDRNWPKAPNKLSALLTNLSEALTASGIDVIKTYPQGKATLSVSIRRA